MFLPPDDMYSRKSAPDVIAERLRSEILLGDIAGGAQLKQSEIATRFNSSIVPVREAFQRLITEGLASAQQNKGVTVTRLSASDFEELAELRVLMEPYALTRSAPNLTREDISNSSALLKKSSETSNLLERAALHWEFHRSLYARCNKPRLLGQIGSLHLSINRYVLPIWSEDGLSPKWDESHDEILDAIRFGRVDVANRLIVDQIHEASERVLKRLKDN